MNHHALTGIKNKWIIKYNRNKEYITTVVNIGWPSIMEAFFIALIGFADTFMVSSVGPYAVAAIGLTIQPKYIGLAIFLALNIAVSALVARRKGEDDRKGANEVLLYIIIITFALGILISLVCVVFANQIIAFAGSNQDTHESAVLYFRIIMGCSVFNVISMAVNAAQRGIGNTKIVMRTNLVSNIVNIIGSYLLVNGYLGLPKLGVAGSAISAVLGSVIACCMSIASISRMNVYISIPYILKIRFKYNWKHIKSMLKIGLSVFAEQIFMRIGFMTVTTMVANEGTKALAAHQIGMNVMTLSFSFGDGLSVAAVALIGQSLGQNKKELALKYGKICRVLGGSISAGLSLIYLVFGKTIYKMFFDEAVIIHYGIQIMHIMVLIVLLQIAQVIYLGCLRGAGDTIFTTVIALISVTIIRPLFGYIFCYGLGFGLAGIWIGMLFDQLTRFGFATYRFKSGAWSKIRI